MGGPGRRTRRTTAATSTCCPSTSAWGSRPSSACTFVTLLLAARLTLAALPDDPEFRAALMGYAEWGTRLAVHNSQPGARSRGASAPVPAVGPGAWRRRTSVDGETAWRLASLSTPA